ncbi:MAG: hypothetical protein NZ482_04040, partial [Gloeomargarita sp. SKYG98]|nr:hypothetical protein [Gloeomargarita sp. SKYG98]
MVRWTDEMLDRLAEQVQANAVAIRELRASVRELREAQAQATAQINANAQAIQELRASVQELREAQALMMEIIQRQENR